MSTTLIQTTEVIISDNDHHISTYRRIRKAIGLLGVGLPIVLVALSFTPFFKTELQSSISHYYYTNLREVFTGTLCAVGLFLILYQGNYNPQWWKNDKLLTNICGAMAFGVAFVPTNPNSAQQKIYTLIPLSDEWIGKLHYGFAGVLFLTFAILSIFAFTIGQSNNHNIPVSRINENVIYRTCGAAIIVFIVMIPISAAFNLFNYSTLMFEALSLLAFGIAWLVKGRILGDKGKIGEKLYREQNYSPKQP